MLSDILAFLILFYVMDARFFDMGLRFVNVEEWKAFKNEVFPATVACRYVQHLIFLT